jgi:hypothetical protein
VPSFRQTPGCKVPLPLGQLSRCIEQKEPKNGKERGVEQQTEGAVVLVVVLVLVDVAASLQPQSVQKALLT